MAEPVHRVSCGDQYFDFADFMADEMAQVKSWTGIKNRQEFFQAVREEDPDAVIAAFALAKRRETNVNPRLADVKVNLDKLRWSWVLEGREVEPITETDVNGEPLIVLLDDRGEPIPGDLGIGYREPTGEDGEKIGLVFIKDEQGRLTWRYTDTGEDVRPTQVPATNGSTGSPSTETKPELSAFGSGIQTTSEI